MINYLELTHFGIGVSIIKYIIYALIYIIYIWFYMSNIGFNSTTVTENRQWHNEEQYAERTLPTYIF